MNKEGILNHNQNLNILLRFYSQNGIRIDIISCQEKIKTNGKERCGRFNLNSFQYNELKSVNGYYLFLVKSGKLIVAGKIISPNDFKFQKMKRWSDIIN